MKLTKKLLFLSAMLVLALSQAGCIQKAFFPEAHFTVESVTPDKLRLAAAATTTTETEESSSEDEKVTLPATTISLISDSTIPADLVSFSITYTTRLGEAIPSVAVPETPFNLKIPGGSTTSIEINPYTNRLFQLLELTRADISPINARMILTIKDLNGNTSHIEASCLCYARWDESDG